MSFKVRTRSDDGSRSLVIERVRSAPRVTLSSSERPSALLRVVCCASDEPGERGTLRPAPSPREGGFVDGGLGASCCAGGVATESHCGYAGAVHEVMPAEADARAEEHGENRTKTVGSQLQPGHGLRLGVRLPVTNGWVAPVGVEPTGSLVRTSPPALLGLQTT